MVGYNDPRNQALVAAIRQRLEAFKGDGSKAFGPAQEPLRKPSAAGKIGPVVRSVKLFATQKSGLQVRGGVANNGDMIRADIFSKDGKYYAVPVYVSHVVRDELPDRAVVADKLEEDWPVMDDSYKFLFSLHPNDWVRVVKKKGEPAVEGYYRRLDRASGGIAVMIHDRNQEIGEDGEFRIGIKTADSVEKYHVDLLGNLYRVGKEERQSLARHRRGGRSVES